MRNDQNAIADQVASLQRALKEEQARTRRLVADLTNSRQQVGGTDAVRGRFYAISVERRLKHPAVVAVCETARRELFGEH